MRNPCTALLFAFVIIIGVPAFGQDATVTTVGDSCGNGDTKPQLLSSRPLLGEAVGILATDLDTTGALYVLVSPVPDAATALGDGCFLYIDPSMFTMVGPYAIQSDRTSYVQLVLPEDPRYAGVRVALQGVSVPEVGLELTNGIIWTLGF